MQLTSRAARTISSRETCRSSSRAGRITVARTIAASVPTTSSIPVALIEINEECGLAPGLFRRVVACAREEPQPRRDRRDAGDAGRKRGPARSGADQRRRAHDPSADSGDPEAREVEADPPHHAEHERRAHRARSRVCRGARRSEARLRVYLQFDSRERGALENLRGADLRRVREDALANLERAGISTTLVCVVKKGVNDHEIGGIVRYALDYSCVRGVTFQPVQDAGRNEGFDKNRDRVVLDRYPPRDRHVGACSTRPTSFRSPAIPTRSRSVTACAMARACAIARLIPKDELLSSVPNTISFERYPELKNRLFDLLSLASSGERTKSVLGDLLCCLPQVEVPSDLGYDKIFRVVIVQFLDRFNFCIASVKRSCIHFIRRKRRSSRSTRTICSATGSRPNCASRRVSQPDPRDEEQPSGPGTGSVWLCSSSGCGSWCLPDCAPRLGSVCAQVPTARGTYLLQLVLAFGGVPIALGALHMWAGLASRQRVSDVAADAATTNETALDIGQRRAVRHRPFDPHSHGALRCARRHSCVHRSRPVRDPVHPALCRVTDDRGPERSSMPR